MVTMSDNNLIDIKNNKAINKLVETLKEPMQELSKMQEMQLNFVRGEVKKIIDNNIKNEQRIQKILDMLLDLTYWYEDDIKSIYYDLLRYYEKMNLDVSKEYEKFYLEIINEEEDF